jgi:RNA-binding protein YhbY
MNGTLKFQIGKQGLTEGVIEALKNHFKTRKVIRISALKGSGRNRETIKQMGDEMVERLGGNYTFNVIGFTIIMKRHSATRVNKEPIVK